MILIAGATGFIGGRLLIELSSSGNQWRGMSRRPSPLPNVLYGNLSDLTSLMSACTGIDCIFHCAGYSHAFSSLGSSNDAVHWRVNFEGTRNLIMAAANAGVRRFINLSSVKAMANPGELCADEEYPGLPTTAYGQSKLAAEQIVTEIGKRYGMHVVNLRLAMVYGAGGRGNLERMARLVRRGLFPPLPETANHRSLVHVDDVLSAMQCVAGDARANGRTYIVASREAPSGRTLLDALRKQLGKPPCSWAVSPRLLRTMARGADVIEQATRKRLPFDSEALDRLLGSAWYSPARIERELGWSAKVSLADGLKEMLGR